MNLSTSIDRDLDVLGSIVVYRVVGRRPSAVYVNSAKVAAATGAAGSRLSDLVYWRTQAGAGDHIQDGPTGLVLITQAGERYRIRLSEPRARTVDTAFTQTSLDIATDRQVIAGLLEHQILVEGRRRPQQKTGAASPLNAMLAEGHPLVVHERPAGFADETVVRGQPLLPPRAAAVNQNAYEAAVSEGWPAVQKRSRLHGGRKPVQPGNSATTGLIGEPG